MNEKIKELAKSVDAVFDVIAMGRHDGVLFTETELERFAKSIFEVCLDNLYFNGYDDAAGQLYKVQKELGLTDGN